MAKSKPRNTGEWVSRTSEARVKSNRVNAKARGRAYRKLAGLYPAEFRRLFEAEKESVLAEGERP